MGVYSGLKLPKARLHVRDATFGRRALSFLADLLLLNIIVYSNFEGALSTVSQTTLAAVVAMCLLTFAYFTLFEYLLQQTPGMMLLNLQAQNATLWRAMLRNIYFIPIFPLPMIGLLEPLHLIWKKTRFMELLSGTRTIEEIRY